MFEDDPSSRFQQKCVSNHLDQIVNKLSGLDAINATVFSTNGDALKAALRGLEAQGVQLSGSHAGGSVAITEPVPLYMLDVAGISNVTPDEFSEAVGDLPRSNRASLAQ